MSSNFIYFVSSVQEKPLDVIELIGRTMKSAQRRYSLANPKQ